MTMIEEGLKVHSFHVEDVVVVVARGDVDADAAAAMRAVFNSLGPDQHLYVDCAAVGFIDSDGLTALCEAAQRNVNAGGPLHTHASIQVRRRIETIGVEHLFAFD